MIKVAGSLFVDRNGSGGCHTLFKGSHAQRLPRRAGGARGASRGWNRRLGLTVRQLLFPRPGELQPVFGTDTRYRFAQLTRWQCRCRGNFLRQKCKDDQHGDHLIYEDRRYVACASGITEEECRNMVVLTMVAINSHPSTLSATTFESMTSRPPPSAAVMNSCVLYASSGHFFRLGNGGSRVGPAKFTSSLCHSFPSSSKLTRQIRNIVASISRYLDCNPYSLYRVQTAIARNFYIFNRKQN